MTVDDSITTGVVGRVSEATPDRAPSSKPRPSLFPGFLPSLGIPSLTVGESPPQELVLLVDDPLVLGGKRLEDCHLGGGASGRGSVRGLRAEDRRWICARHTSTPSV